MINTVIKRVATSPVQRSVVGGVSGSVREIVRNFLQFNGTDIRAVMNVPIVFNGDFEVEVKAVATANTAQWVAGQSGGYDQRLIFNRSLNLYQFITNATEVNGSVTAEQITGWHVVKARRIGTVKSLYLDGDLLNSNAAVVAPSQWGVIGAATNGSALLNGEIEYIKFTDLETGTITTYNISSGSITTEYAAGESAPSAKYITYLNVAEGDWLTKRWNATTEVWDAI